MADPVTLALFAAAGTAVAGGVMGYQAGQSEAAVAEQNAIAAAREGTVLAGIEAQKSREATGRARMLAASSGLSVDGSASSVIGAMAAQGQFNAGSALYQGRRRVQQSHADAAGAKMRGKASLISGFSQAGTVLTSHKAPAAGGAPVSGSTASVPGRMGPL